jgi:NAD(P) transhydrogenase
VYTIPELACVGLDEASAREKHGTVLVGRAPFAQTARGMIAGNEEGFLKLVASPDGERVLGVAAVGEGASELVSVGQVAMLAGFPVDRFVRSVFNFPTMMEAYRLAAVDIRRQRERGAQPAAAAE